MTTLTQEYLLKRLSYDPETGIFVWLLYHDSLRHDQYAGKQAGTVLNSKNHKINYLQIKIDGRRYKAHRLAFLYMTGKLPTDGVDHRDGNGLNNRWMNIRVANNMQNSWNRGLHINNKVGLKGVIFFKRNGRFRAQIVICGKKKHLGMFATANDAHKAYVIAAKNNFGEFSRAA